VRVENHMLGEANHLKWVSITSRDLSQQLHAGEALGLPTKKTVSWQMGQR